MRILTLYLTCSIHTVSLSSTVFNEIDADMKLEIENFAILND